VCLEPDRVKDLGKLDRNVAGADNADKLRLVLELKETVRADAALGPSKSGIVGAPPTAVKMFLARSCSCCRREP
jgi:hypothetical protein